MMRTLGPALGLRLGQAIVAALLCTLCACTGPGFEPPQPGGAVTIPGDAGPGSVGAAGSTPSSGASGSGAIGNGAAGSGGSEAADSADGGDADAGVDEDAGALR